MKDYPISIGVESVEWYMPGKIADAHAWASYDEGVTWVDVPVTAKGGKQVVSVDNTAVGAGGLVTLKVELTDANGVGVAQTLKRLYGLR